MKKFAAFAAAAVMALTAGCGASAGKKEQSTTTAKTYIPPETTVSAAESSAPETETAQDSEAEPKEPEKEEIFDTAPLARAYITGDNTELDDLQKQILLNAAKAVAECTTEDMTAYQKELALHDWLIRNCTYDKGELRAIPKPGEHCSDPYGALVDGEAICMGYTTTFKLFMDMLEIPCGIVHSVDSEGDEHAWNTVQLDGSWYYVDTTWDDPVPDEPDRDIKHQFFNITKDEISIEHVLPEEAPDTDSSEFLFATQEIYTVTSLDEISDGVAAAAGRGHSDVALYFDMEDMELEKDSLFSSDDDYYIFTDRELYISIANECKEAGMEYLYSCLRSSDRGTVLLIDFGPR